MKLEGFGIFVENMGAMVRFYRDALGFEIREEDEAENVYLVKDGVLFLLYRRRDFENMTGRPYAYSRGLSGHFEVALGVENHAAVDRAYAAVVRAGGRSVMPPTTEPWGQRTCYVADPEGNLIEIAAFEGGGE